MRVDPADLMPAPECSYGYTIPQVEEILGPERAGEFWKYMHGQTMTLCNGREYDHGKREYVPTGHSHGGVVYGTDLSRFLRGRPPLD